jgi:hypothetical protein
LFFRSYRHSHSILIKPHSCAGKIVIFSNKQAGDYTRNRGIREYQISNQALLHIICFLVSIGFWES